MNKEQYLENPQFASYLAGLWEGDGHITLLKYNEQNVPVNTPAFHVTFGIRNLPACKLLCSYYGGWISEKRKENALVWTIGRTVQLISITTLLKGLLRTPKIHEFNLLVAHLNGKSPVKELLLGMDSSPLENNWWLAGFIDADGAFKIRVSPGKGRRIECRFAIEQRKHHAKTGNAFEPLFRQIAQMLQVRLNTSTHHGTNYWCIECSAVKKLSLLRNYLDNFPLMTSAFLDYQDWRQAHQLIIEGNHLTPEGRHKIASLKENINSKRTLFNWNHKK